MIFKSWRRNLLSLVILSAIFLLNQIILTQQVSVVPNIDHHTLLPNIESDKQLLQKKLLPSAIVSIINTKNDDDSSSVLIDLNNGQTIDSGEGDGGHHNESNNNDDFNKQIRQQHSLNYLVSVMNVGPNFSIISADNQQAVSSNQDRQQQQKQLDPSDTKQKHMNDNVIRASSLKRIMNLLVDSHHDHSSDKIDITLANDAWKLMRLNAQQYAKEKVEEARPIINRLIQLADVSNDCRQSILHILDRLKHLDHWAIQMWNAWGDFPATGLFEGTFNSMGSYHGCIDTKPNKFIGEAQYCAIKYQPVIPKRPRFHNILATIPDLANFTQEQDVFSHFAKKAQYFYYTKLRWSTCLPTKCSKSDVESLAETIGAKAILQYSGVECLKKEINVANKSQRFAITVLICLALVSVLGTLSHVFNIEKYGQEWSYTPPLIKRFLSCMMHFSMLRNIRKLFDTQTSNRANDIGCIHGLRFWTISWIIFGHTLQYTEWAGFGRAFQIEENLISFAIQPLLNATFSVDTFFLISGLLTTYVTWSLTKGDYEYFNKGAFIVSRYLRLTPQVLLVTLLFIVFPLTGEGPFWKGLIQKESENCQNNWWVNALYLQAFFRSDQICNLVTWWLSIEMFYHLVSVIVIIVLLKSRFKGLMTALVMGLGFTMVSFYLHYVNHYPPNMLPTHPQRFEIWDSLVRKFFWTPFPHAAAYFVGLMLGFVLYTRCIKKLSKSQVRNGWIFFLVTYLSILWSTYGWNKNEPYTRLVSSVYYHSCQILWALATGWAILACVLGRGGWLNRFLSLPIFIPLGRATYMTYLAHMLVVMSYPASMNLLIEPSYLSFVYIFVSNLVFSNVLGITLTIIYESPIVHLQKLLISKMATKFEPIQIQDDEKDLGKTATALLMSNSAATNPTQEDQQIVINTVNNNVTTTTTTTSIDKSDITNNTTISNQQSSSDAGGSLAVETLKSQS